jgi:hypothetical protein
MKALIGLPILSNGASQKNCEIGPHVAGFRNQPNGSKLFVLNGRFLNLARMGVGGYNAYHVRWCAPVLHQIQDEVGPENFIVLAYHRNSVGSAATLTDPFHTQDSVDRHLFYNCCTNSPTMWFSGLYEVKNRGDMTVEAWYALLKPWYDTVKRTMSLVELSLNGAIIMEAEGRYRADVQAVVTATDRIRGRYRVWFVLSEDALMALGNFFPEPFRMTTFDWVVRDVLPTEPLTITQAGQQQMVSRSVTLDPTWQRENLNMVVFVQKESQGFEILQAASVDLLPPQ